MKKMIELNQTELAGIVGGYCEENSKDFLNKPVCGVRDFVKAHKEATGYFIGGIAGCFIAGKGSITQAAKVAAYTAFVGVTIVFGGAIGSVMNK